MLSISSCQFGKSNKFCTKTYRPVRISVRFSGLPADSPSGSERKGKKTIPPARLWSCISSDWQMSSHNRAKRRATYGKQCGLPAESFNAKIKSFRAQLREVTDVKMLPLQNIRQRLPRRCLRLSAEPRPDTGLPGDRDSHPHHFRAATKKPPLVSRHPSRLRHHAS